MAQNEISSRAAQSYIESYYFQLKATRVSFIHSPTHLQTTQDLTGPVSPSCLTAPYMWTVNRTNQGKVEPGKLRGKDEESNVLLQMRNEKAFLYDGRRARQFSNIWDISFAGPQSHFTRWQMLNVFWAHQGPLDQPPVFDWNVNVVWEKERKKRLKRQRGEYFVHICWRGFRRKTNHS